MSIFHLQRIGLAASLALALTAGAALAQSSAPQSASPDEDALIERVKEAVLKDLIDKGILADQVQQGIQEYVRDQQRKRQQVQSDREKQASEQAKNVRRADAARDHIRGSADAVVSLIEYSDFECPYCKRFHVTAKQVMAEYAGRANWVYRHFPLSFHNPGAEDQAVASECAAKLGGNDDFWKFTDKVYERTNSGGKGFPAAQLVPLAEEIGLDKDAFAKCLDDPEIKARVQQDIDEGSKFGIRGTPGNILINNKTGEVKALPGAVPPATLKQAIEELLKAG